MNPRQQVIRVERSEHPAQISRSWPANKAMSCKAKGILAYCLSRRAMECITVDSIIASSTDGRRSIRSGLRELEQLGHAQFQRLRNHKGHVIGTRWRILEDPVPTVVKQTLNINRQARNASVGVTDGAVLPPSRNVSVGRRLSA